MVKAPLCTARFDSEVDLTLAAFDFREVAGFSIQPDGFDTPTRYCSPVRASGEAVDLSSRRGGFDSRTGYWFIRV